MRLVVMKLSTAESVDATLAADRRRNWSLVVEFYSNVENYFCLYSFYRGHF